MRSFQPSLISLQQAIQSNKDLIFNLKQETSCLKKCAWPTFNTGTFLSSSESTFLTGSF